MQFVLNSPNLLYHSTFLFEGSPIRIEIDILPAPKRLLFHFTPIFSSFFFFSPPLYIPTVNIRKKNEDKKNYMCVYVFVLCARIHLIK